MSFEITIVIYPQKVQEESVVIATSCKLVVVSNLELFAPAFSLNTVRSLIRGNKGYCGQGKLIRTGWLSSTKCNISSTYMAKKYGFWGTFKL